MRDWSSIISPPSGGQALMRAIQSAMISFTVCVHYSCWRFLLGIHFLGGVYNRNEGIGRMAAPSAVTEEDNRPRRPAFHRCLIIIVA
ncbi:hypothetical protein KCP71_18695 [Salmonella enterica subsp. enterica]|nr:hypothetical protein KCP71_18695 [Salmonella enterica subsp. enterica]